MAVSANLVITLLLAPALLAHVATATSPTEAEGLPAENPSGRWIETPKGTQTGVAAVEPRRIDLRLQVRPALPTVLIEADLTFRVLESVDSVVWFLRPDMNLDAIEDADGIPLAYSRRRSIVRVSTPSLDRGADITWTFRYRARFSESLAERGQMLLTTPWYPHARVTPDPDEFQRYVPMPMSMTATLPDPWVLVSSGTNRTTAASDGDTTYTWRDSVPSPQIPLAIGRFIERTRRSEIGAVRGFFAPDDRSLLRPYMDYVAQVAAFFSDRIGQITRRSWNLVAIELPNQVSGQTVPGVTFLERRDIDASNPFPYRVLAHEVAHLWWNHYVEIPRARDAWLREGLPTYSSLMFLANAYGNQMMRLELERSRRVALSVDTGEPLEMGFEMETAEAVYALNYHKAAFVLHMLREVMGLDAFAELLRRLYGLQEDLTTEVFVREAQAQHGDDLSWFFDPWLRTADIPSFAVRYGYRRTEDGSSRYQLSGTIEQRDAAIRFPVLVRVPLEAAPPLETTVWVEPGVSEFSILLPSPPRDLLFDPRGDLLYREVTVEPVDVRGSAFDGRKEEPFDGAAERAKR